MKPVITIRTTYDIAALLDKWARRREENFIAITLNTHHDVIKVHHISKGSAEKTVVHCRESFFHAIKDNAVKIAFAHNHPSGYVQPSPEDNDMATKLEMAGMILGIPVLDNLIIARNGLFYSYRANKKMNDDTIYTVDEVKAYAELIAAENKGV
jgi:DNA repair protein RadC